MPPLREHNEPTSQATKDEIAAFLEHINQLEHDVLNSFDFDHKSPEGQIVKEHIATGYKAYLDNFPHPLTHDEANAMYAESARANPRLNFRVTEMWSEVDVLQGRATVYTQLICRGWVHDEAEIKAFSEASWRLQKNGRWVMYKYYAMRSGELDDGAA